MAIHKKDFDEKMEEVKKKLKESVIVPEKLKRTDKLCFKCYPGIKCFNACCSGIRINLTPYDIFRLTNRLKMSYHDFLMQYTVPRSIDGTPLPIIVIKMRDDDIKSCPFNTPDGCAVYSDRPVTCRYYPIGMALMKQYENPEGEDFFIKIREDHCFGHNEPTEWTIDEWRADQEADLYDEMNKDWVEVVLKAKSLGIVEFSQRSLDLFFMVSSNLDLFRDFVFNSNFLNAYDLQPELVERIKEDELELLRFSLKWLRFTMFGEGDFKIKDEAQKESRERMKAAVQEKIKAKKARDKELLSKKPEEIMKEADEEK